MTAFNFALLTAFSFICSASSYAHTPSRFSKDMDVVRKKQVISNTCSLEVTIGQSEFAPGLRKHVEALMRGKGYIINSKKFKKRTNADGKIASDFGPVSDFWLYIDLNQHMVPSTIEVDLTRFIYADTFRTVIKPDHAELYLAKFSRSWLGITEKTTERVLKILDGIKICQRPDDLVSSCF